MTADTDIELNFGTPVPKAEPGTYPAILVGIEPFKIGEGTPDAKTLLRWQFSLDGTEDPEMPGMTIILEGVTSLATGPRSKMRPWVQALLGRALTDTDRWDLPALQKLTIGHPCLVMVEINEAGYSKVANVVPPPRQPARPASAVPTMPAPLLREEPPVDPGPTDPDEIPYETPFT